MQVPLVPEEIIYCAPEKQWLKGSFQISSKPAKSLNEWSNTNHAASYDVMRDITDSWLTKQFLLYSKIDENNPFKWEIVPYQNCSNFFSRFAQQLLVLWRSIFGGTTVSDAERKTQDINLKDFRETSRRASPYVQNPQKGTDAFCNDEVIEKQWVWKGKTVNILYNYAPIGDFHFLIVPNKHRSFRGQTEEEYCETLDLTKKLWTYLNTKKNVKGVHLLLKEGKDAGATQDHNHLNVIAETSWGKWQVFIKMLIGSYYRMTDDKLKEKVTELRAKFVASGCFE